MLDMKISVEIRKYGLEMKLLIQICFMSYWVLLLVQQFPSSATTLHFEYYEEIDETKAEKKVGLLHILPEC